jgi:hypothetical protein
MIQALLMIDRGGMHRSSSTGAIANADHITVELQNQALRTAGNSYSLHWSNADTWRVFPAIKTLADKEKKAKKKGQKEGQKAGYTAAWSSRRR